MTVVCDQCAERYTELLVVAGEPCPKVSCSGELADEERSNPTEGTHDGVE